MFPADAIPRAAVPSRDALLPAIVMLGAAANAVVVQIVEGLATGAAASLTLGISPFQVLALFVGLRLSLSGSHEFATPAWLTFLTVGLILVPSSAVSWAALAFYSGAIALHAKGEQRTGALLLFATAAAALWSSVLLKWIAQPVTAFEAWPVSHVLQLFRSDIVRIANTIGNPDTHTLILMTRCTTADALPIAAVAIVAVSFLLGRPDPARLWQAVSLAGVLYFVVNTLRLALMATSSEMYALVHGPVGANLFDLFQTTLVLLLGNWVSRP